MWHVSCELLHVGTDCGTQRPLIGKVEFEAFVNALPPCSPPPHTPPSPGDDGAPDGTVVGCSKEVRVPEAGYRPALALPLSLSVE
jgi:hypothetical protein